MQRVANVQLVLSVLLVLSVMLVCNVLLVCSVWLVCSVLRGSRVSQHDAGLGHVLDGELGFPAGPGDPPHGSGEVVTFQGLH